MPHTASPVQSLLFVGSYAAAAQPGIHVFQFDDATGTLTALGSFTGIANPSFLIVHPNRRWLYAVSEMSRQNDSAHGAVWGFCFEREPLAFLPINHQSTKGNWPCPGAHCRSTRRRTSSPIFTSQSMAGGYTSPIGVTAGSQST
jgi:6-phosphogluconolactonase (cycloisomerase 2 family)